MGVNGKVYIGWFLKKVAMYSNEQLKGIALVEKLKSVKKELSYNGELDEALSIVMDKYHPSVDQLCEGLDKFKECEKIFQAAFSLQTTVSIEDLTAEEFSMAKRDERKILRENLY